VYLCVLCGSENKQRLFIFIDRRVSFQGAKLSSSVYKFAYGIEFFERKLNDQSLLFCSNNNSNSLYRSIVVLPVSSLNGITFIVLWIRLTNIVVPICSICGLTQIYECCDDEMAGFVSTRSVYVFQTRFCMRWDIRWKCNTDPAHKYQIEITYAIVCFIIHDVGELRQFNHTWHADCLNWRELKFWLHNEEGPASLLARNDLPDIAAFHQRCTLTIDNSGNLCSAWLNLLTYLLAC